MSMRQVYVSHAAEDLEDVRRLVGILEAVGIGVVTGQPDAIAGASMFLACFSAGADGTARYDRDELQRAGRHARLVGGTPPWLAFAKLTPCEIPALADTFDSVPVFDLHGQWHESIVRIIAPPSASTEATLAVTVGQVCAGDAGFTNVTGDGDSGVLGTGDARSEIAIKTMTVDRKLDFTNVRARRL